MASLAGLSFPRAVTVRPAVTIAVVDVKYFIGTAFLLLRDAEPLFSGSVAREQSFKSIAGTSRRRPILMVGISFRFAAS